MISSPTAGLFHVKHLYYIIYYKLYYILCILIQHAQKISITLCTLPNTIMLFLYHQKQSNAGRVPGEGGSMKARYSEQYYRNNWDRFIKRVPGDDYMNLEHELDNEIKIFDDETKEMVKNIYAKLIYEKAILKLCERCAMIDNIEKGVVTLGYTNKTQEVHEMNRIIQRFEFNCLQARIFKEKYIAS